MIKLTQKKTETVTISLTDEEAKKVTIEYLRDVIIGDSCYITKGGRLEHWTSYPHGSGTTTDKGMASQLQLAAWGLLKAFTAEMIRS